MRAVRQTNRGGRARNFLQRHAMLEIAEPRAAILLLDGDAVQAKIAEFRPQIARKLVRLVDLGGAWRDLMRREVADRFAYRVCGLAEVEIEHPLRVGNHHILSGRAQKTLLVRANHVMS